MSYGVWSLVIFLTFAVGMLGIWVLLDRGQRELDRIEMLARLDLVAARVCSLCGGSYDNPQARCPCSPAYGPFPANMGPLLLLSEQAAALVESDRWTRRAISETDWLIEAGEREIGPVQP